MNCERFIGVPVLEPATLSIRFKSSSSIVIAIVFILQNISWTSLAQHCRDHDLAFSRISILSYRKGTATKRYKKRDRKLDIWRFRTFNRVNFPLIALKGRSGMKATSKD